jgi:ankyrin repeat protein
MPNLLDIQFTYVLWSRCAPYYCLRGSGREAAVEACQFLLESGAHADWEDEIGKVCCTTTFIASSVTKFQFSTLMETMIDNTLISSAMEQALSHGQHLSQFQHIVQISGKSIFDLLNDFVENRNFTTLREVLPGITSDRGTLDEYLASFGQATLPAEFIDSHDACGRTALAWAAENGWADAVKTLLKYGSNPHQLRPSVRGKSPLLHLVMAGPSSQHSDAGFLDVVRQLLKAGVDFNAVDHEGWTPLHVAPSWNASDMIKELAASAESELRWN